MKKMEKLSFKISSGLKNIIGRELITDKTIAIFEIVKNSYDAGAKKVVISFDNIYTENASITVSDDGTGMSREDIINKWLFVAYSEKKSIRNNAYIDNINEKRTYAGAKGIGRFSCDRLGGSLDLYSKKSYEKKTNLLHVNWDDFEQDAEEEFVDVSVQHKYVDCLPSKNSSGTSVVISNLREIWSRKDILDLKKALVKLVNPYENEDDVFEIHLSCIEELETDKKQQNERDVVNGKLQNYVFETLNLKTTQISVSISEDGREITTKMFDRGTFLFELIQKSNFRYLKNVKTEIFYLNRAAKINFRRIMGVSPLEFGSVFVYKNGFRIMPYGEPGADMFNIDRRKTQGYNRFLGTRDIMGRIVILGDNPDFIETSSRDGGFIRSNSFDELEDFYKKYAHLPLEKYVVNLISWGDEFDSGKDAIQPEDIKDDIIKYVTNYERKGEIISINVNDELFDIYKSLKEKDESKIVTELKNLAKVHKDQSLEKIASRIEAENKKHKEEKSQLEKIVDDKSEELSILDSELKATKKQALFLRGLSNPKYENATESLHLMNTYAKSIKLNIKNLAKAVNKSKDEQLKAKIKNYISEIVNATQKINSTYTFAFSADYDIRQQIQTIDLYLFIKQYIENALFSKTGEFVKIHIDSTSVPCFVKIDPLEFSMIIENIIYNSYKARANNLNISISKDNEYVVIKFTDDGVGLNKSIENKDSVFELCYSTTGGTGIGLSHAKKVISNWGGTIEIDDSYKKGFSIIVRLKNEY